MVDFAIEANRILTAAKSGLDEAKAHLRDLAKASGADAEFQGNLGTAQVTLVARPRAKSGVDLVACYEALPVVLQRLFTPKTTVNFVEDFEDRVEKLAPDQRAVIHNLIEIKPQTPRVTVPQ